MKTSYQALLTVPLVAQPFLTVRHNNVKHDCVMKRYLSAN